MDSTPPQAPPAIVAHAQQETLDALRRLLATQDWLGRQDTTLPSLPERPTSNERDGWLASLDAFWAQPATASDGSARRTRVDALAAGLAAVMRDDAIVRGKDQTFDHRAAALARRFARAESGGAPPDLEAFALLVGSADYAGAVIVRDRNDATLALLFMPDKGWEAYDGVDALHAQVEARFRRTLGTGRGLPGLTVDDVERVIADERFVDSRPLGDDAFQQLARRVIAVQRAKVDDAWASIGEQDGPASFVDEARAALDLHAYIDIAALLSARGVRLNAAMHEERLAAVHESVREDLRATWTEAVEGYRLAHRDAMVASRLHESEAPLSLQAFSQRRLKAALVRHAVDLEPDDILIEVSDTLSSLAGGAASPVQRLNLADLALRNIGWLEDHTLRIVADALAPGTTAPSVATLKNVVHEADIASHYARYVDQQLSSANPSPFHVATRRLHAARMRVDAVNARIASWLDDEPDAFIDDREERGYRMVEAALDAPVAADRRKVGGHEVTVSELVYRGAVVADVLVIGMKDPRSVSRVVMYTPGAPDGRPFREFHDRAAAGREFLYAPAFTSYLLDRLPVEFGETVPAAHGVRRFRVSDETRRSHWVFAAPGDGRGALTEAPFEDRVIHGNLLDAQLRAELRREAYDVAYLGRTRSQANIEAVRRVLGMVSQGQGGAGHLVTGTIGAVGQALRATWRFYDSAKAGDSAQAFVDFTEAYTSALNIVPLASGPAAGARLTLRSARQGARAVDAGVGTLRSRQGLDPRYATRGIDLAGSTQDAAGMHRIGEHRYIRQHGLVFEVRYDPAFDTWRLARPGKPHGIFSGPAVEAGVSGVWQWRADVGLRGGWTNRYYTPDPNRILADRRVIQGRDLDGLSEFQRWTFQQQLGRNLRSMGEANRIVFQTSYPRGTTRVGSMRQQTAWNDALRVARASPSEPIMPGTGPAPGAGWRVLDPHDWPESVWHRNMRIGMSIGRDGTTSIPLDAQPGSGLVGVQATALAPIDGVVVPVGQGLAAPDWLRLNLHRLRSRIGPDGRPPIRVIEVRRDPVAEYVVQPSRDMVPAVALRHDDYTGVDILAVSRSPTPPPSRSPSPSP